MSIICDNIKKIMYPIQLLDHQAALKHLLSEKELMHLFFSWSFSNKLNSLRWGYTPITPDCALRTLAETINR